MSQTDKNNLNNWQNVLLNLNELSILQKKGNVRKTLHRSAFMLPLLSFFSIFKARLMSTNADPGTKAVITT